MHKVGPAQGLMVLHLCVRNHFRVLARLAADLSIVMIFIIVFCSALSLPFFYSALSMIHSQGFETSSEGDG